MRTCQEYEELISAFLDGELSEAERVETGAHLASCPACQRYFDDLVAMHDAFDQVEDVPVPEGFSARVMSRVRETPRAEETKMIRFPRWRRWAALAACCAIAVLGLWSFQSRSGDTGAASQTVMAGSGPAAARDAAPPVSAVELEDVPMALMEESGEAVSSPEEAPALADGYSEAQKQYTDNAGDADASLAFERDSAEQQLSGSSAVGTGSMPEPAMTAPASDEREEPLSGSITASGKTARVWVETELGLDWEPGRAYLLTEEEFSGLLDALTAAGEDFQLEDSEGCWLLAEP